MRVVHAQIVALVLTRVLGVLGGMHCRVGAANSRWTIAACAAARGAQPSLLHGNQGRHDGARHHQSLQAKVRDYRLL